MSEISHKVNDKPIPEDQAIKTNHQLPAAIVGGLLFAAGASIDSYGILTLFSFALLAICFARNQKGFIVPMALWGSVAYLGSLSWMIRFGWLPWLLLVIWHLIVILIPVVLVLSLLRTSSVIVKSLAVASTFVLGERLLGWGDLGVTMASAANPLADNLILLQLASIGGFPLLSFIVAFCGMLLGFAMRDRSRPPAMLAFCLLVVCHIAGGVLLAIPLSSTGKVKIAALQGVTADGFSKPMSDQEALETYEKLTIEAAKENPAVIIWPETSVPGHPNLDENLADHLSNIASAADTWVYVGAILKQQVGLEMVRRNVMLLYDEDGLMQGTYEKLRLTPFGEYVPFRDRLPDLQRWQVVKDDYAFGREWPHLTTSGARFGFLLCSESMFADLARLQVQQGANILAIPSNDSWFGRSNAVIQLYRLAKLRAVESGRSLVRASETGRTVMLDAHGRTLSSVPLFRKGVDYATLKVHSHRTAYQKIADWEGWILVALIVISLAWGVIRDET